MRHDAALALHDTRSIASAAPLRSRRPSRSTPLMRVCAENGMNVACSACDVALAQVRTALGQHHDAAPFRRLVGQRRRAAPHRPARARLTPCAGMNAVACRLPSVIVPVLSSSSTSTSPAASTARPDDGDHIRLDHAVHAGDADGREQPADGRRNQADQQRHQHGDRDRRALPRRLHAVDRERQQRHRQPAGR